MKFTQEQLNDLKRDALTYGVDALMTPESFIQLVEELERTRSALREMVTRFKGFPDGCDHDVGICWCAEIHALEQAEKALGQ